ncbi:membrane hypothetical protein [uncultured delta proteobacterium]|uniref:Tripartite ATP-independent periplasmic transporters DctQ component domain-containing protein n=1 Tax=uncultured delta proteobacterium TaxID=34034 RepID=A0A212JBZ1_9DELT|nr:membrane hypothetical protein [uncultured delta proteobacterium]
MITKIFDRLQWGLNVFTALLLGSVCAIIFVQVIMRYVMGNSIAWSEELTRYMFVWIIFLGIHLGIRDGNQIKIDVLESMLKGKSAKALRLVQHLVSLAAVVACLVASIYLIRVGFRASSPTLRIPMWYAYLAFPVGFTVNIIEILRQMARIVQGWNLNEEGEAV